MIIYQIQNKITKKLYIGYSTKFNSNEELQKSRYWGSGIHIKNAVKKYGINNFERLVLVENICDFEELKNNEILWITKKNTKHPNGYNLTDGGGGKWGWKASEKTKEKLRLSLTNNPKVKRAWTPERRKQQAIRAKERLEKYRNNYKGENNPMYGVHRFGKDNPMYGVHRFGKDNPNYRHGKYSTKEDR
jgi:group I intron endonuclease